MVKVREDYPVNADGDLDLDVWLDRLATIHTIDNAAELMRACKVAQQAQLEAEANASDEVRANSFQMGLEMVTILAELQQGTPALVAAVLYRSVREQKLPLETVRKDFGEETAKLIDGVLKMASIGSHANARTNSSVLGATAQQDNIRRMLVAMIDDVRVALIKIAERTSAIRAVKSAPRKKRYLVAREVFDIYAPLAHRLGIGHIKWELEDLSFRYLKPNDYKTIAKLLDEKRLDRQDYIDNVVNVVKEELKAANIEGEVSGRAKHIYSIWRKMQRKAVDFSQIYDVRAVRILVPQVADCYTALGLVHKLWRNIPHEFDDYIASPKPNGYRSLHTAAFGPEGKVIEIQIRTREMHEEAELGVCAHHLYKGTDVKSSSNAYEDKITWLRQVLEWHEDIGDSEELGELIRGDVVQDRVYVFTPEGHIVDMPSGSTPVDFAYRVHTEIGHRCRGAKVSGRIVPLTRILKTGDQVEILTTSEERPRRDWLNPNLGYVTSSRARAKIANWFKLQDKEKNVVAGRKIVDREFRRLALDSEELNLNEIAKAVNYKNADDMFAALGAGDLRLAQIIGAAQRFIVRHEEKEQLNLGLQQAQPKEHASEIRFKGVGSLLTTIATCCQPEPGDPISGYITLGRGVSVHREDCSNIVYLSEKEPGRIIEVNWGDEVEETFPADIYIEAYDRSGLLRDIMILLADSEVNIIAANTLSDKSNNIARLSITVEITGLEILGFIMDKINQLPNVIEVYRKRAQQGLGE